MFEWLDDELATIKTRKFHIVDGPADDELREAIANTELPVPRAYKECALRFGNSKLYRQDGFSLYWLTLLASLREVVTDDGETLYRFGAASNLAYFKQELLSGDKDSPVFEWIGAGQYLRKVADGFEEWIETCRLRARKKYTKRRWKEIIEGPPPFTDAENAIVEARGLFRWKVVGVADDGDVLFEVYNGSRITLSYLCIEIRGAFNGGVHLRVGHIEPSQTAIVAQDCYKDCVSPDRIEFLEEPMIPEERDVRWEFREF